VDARAAYRAALQQGGQQQEQQETATRTHEHHSLKFQAVLYRV
jgi:hypothetical protein